MLNHPSRNRLKDFSGDQKHLTDLIKQGLRHKGFSFIDVFSPCVTYDHDNTYPWFKARVKRLEDDPGYDPRNWMMAMKKSQLWGEEIPIGKFYENPETPPLPAMEPVLDEGGPLGHRDARIAADVVREFVAELM